MKLEELSQVYLFEYADLDIAKKLVADCSCRQISSGNIDFKIIKGGCGTCPICKMIKNDSYPNMLSISSEKSIGIDEVRAIKNFIALKPCYDKRNYIIINCKNGITIQAQNALLKQLEEPPDGSYFFIIGTRKSYLLPTVLSRLIVINENYNNKQDTDKKLKDYIFKNDYNGLKQYIIKWKRNQLGDALLAIAREASFVDSEKLIDVVIKIVNGNSNIKLTMFSLLRTIN